MSYGVPILRVYMGIVYCLGKVILVNTHLMRFFLDTIACEGGLST